MSYLYYINDFTRPLQDSFWSKKYWFKNFNVYMAHRNYERAKIAKMDFEQSFTGQFLVNGFTVYAPEFGWHLDRSFNPTLNWFGVSIYSPDRLFLKGDKSMIMSLQGHIVPYNDKYATLFEDKAIRYIKISNGDKIIYEDWTGNLPDKELIKEFLK